MHLDIRPAIAADTPELAELMQQLGYHWTPSELAERLQQLRANGHEIWVACQSGETSDTPVIGCISAILDVRLAEGCVGEIVSLVVSEECRGGGVGQALMLTAEAWLKPQVSSIRIRANTRREEAHGFYLRAGYQPHKLQQVFVKNCRQ
ncbi:GNAT family N-acetyltransferase [Aliamphritea ceti]|uniref:GNAT family N-acetyltransferase n=1 Tax=Aliamphritea ceti TaxID=1524258 RepID=UPI0021C30425|nr:GNAT family N-acetyltransferase [Aliamphritea ceti]